MDRWKNCGKQHTDTTLNQQKKTQQQAYERIVRKTYLNHPNFRNYGFFTVYIIGFLQKDGKHKHTAKTPNSQKIKEKQ